jgi:membrane-bound lytic murein transglycosylase
MPLPKPLKKGASKKKKEEVVKATMHDLKVGPHHKDRTHAQEVAIAMKQSGQSKKAGKKETVADAKERIDKKQHRRKRNLGRS